MSAQEKNLLLIGGNGMLAQKIASSVPPIYTLTAVDLPEFDMTDQAQVLSVVNDLQPEIIINCAAYTNVDGCETEQQLAINVNGAAVSYLAEAARSVNATLVHISTDYVFDGEKKAPYVEEDLTNPQSVYGHSKLMGEQAILTSGLKKYFIVRTSWLYGPGGNNFVETILRLAGDREELQIVADQVGSPTYTGDLADAIFNLLGAVPSPYGTYHFANAGQCSWYDFAEEIVSRYKAHGGQVKAEVIKPISTEEYPLPAKRPAYSVFDKTKYCAATGASIPDWQDGLDRYLIIRGKG
jgi:dTDP-4-dehydrorhamnose reductase